MSTLHEMAEAIREPGPILTPAQWAVIHCALRAAQDQYATDAHACDASNQPRLAEAFRRQGAEARTLREMIEQHFGL